MTGMILAAGLGTRLGDLTRERPKALLEVNGWPMIEIIANRMWRAGYNRIIVNVHHHASSLIGFLHQWSGPPIEWIISDEREKLLDTGGAIRKASVLMPHNEPVLVHNADILSNADLKALTRYHIDAGNDLTLMVKHRPTSRFLLVDENRRFIGWENPLEGIRIVEPGNQSAGIRIGFSGIYMISHSIFNSFPDEDVFGLFQWLLKQSRNFRIGTWDQGSSFWYEIGRPESLETAINQLVIDPETPDFLLQRT